MTERTADEWEAYLEDNQDEVLMLIGEDFEIHTFEHDRETDTLMFVRGGRHGYNYEGSRAALETVTEDDSEAYKVVPRDEEMDERQKLVDGEYDSVEEWTNV